MEVERPVRAPLQGPREMRGWLGPGHGVEVHTVALRTDPEGQGSRRHWRLGWQVQGHATVKITPRVGFFWNLGERMVSVTKRRKMEEG